MAELILHHYPESLFSEKARAILNARKLAWRSVIIPMIMPRPDTIPLTGGYRRTPVLQVGADVYCDTALIAAYLDDKGEGPTLYPAGSLAAANTLARWVDTELFWAAVTLRFQLGDRSSFFPNEDVARAFAADRANFSQGATTRQIPVQEARPRWGVVLDELEAQLSDGRPYLFGADWTIADFSVYHVAWFVQGGGGGVAKQLKRHKAVNAWFERMRAFSAPTGTAMSGAEALDVALKATPIKVEPVTLVDIAIGATVDVAPTDYGVMPSRGVLLKCDRSEIVIRRADKRTGEVQVHFPRLGFEVRKAE